MKAVEITSAARAELNAIVANIREDDPLAAENFADRLNEAFDRVARFPLSGRTIPEHPDRPFREVLVRPYRVFYHVTTDKVLVVAFWHGAQIPPEPGA